MKNVSIFFSTAHEIKRKWFPAIPDLHRAIRSFVISCIILTMHATHLIQMSRKLRGKINMKLKAYSLSIQRITLLYIISIQTLGLIIQHDFISNYKMFFVEIIKLNFKLSQHNIVTPCNLKNNILFEFEIHCVHLFKSLIL